MNPANRRAAFGATVSLLIAAACGCGGDLQPVTGIVTLDDAPLVDAQIQFAPIGVTGSEAYGRTDEDGVFAMEFSATEKGMAPGEYRVSITTGDVADPVNDVAFKPERVPTKYNSESELIVEVKSGEKNHFPFTLTGGGLLQQPGDDD